MDVTFRHKQGHYDVVVSAALFEIDGEKYMMLVVKDVSEQRAAEQQIHEINQQLEERVLQRTLSHEQANAELARALETLRRTTDELVRSEKVAALGSLVAGVSHEINTPIGIGVTAASYLAEKSRALILCFESGMLTREELSATSVPGPTRPGPMARLNASRRPACASGPMSDLMSPRPNARPPCSPSSTAITGFGHTPP